MQKLQLLVLVATIALIGSVLIFKSESIDTSLRVKTRHGDYASNDPVCTAACSAKGGVSCGRVDANCCQAAQCEHKFYGAQNCHARIPVVNCTTA